MAVQMCPVTSQAGANAVPTLWEAPQIHASDTHPAPREGHDPRSSLGGMESGVPFPPIS